MVRKPERDQENQLTSQYIDPHEDAKSALTSWFHVSGAMGFY